MMERRIRCAQNNSKAAPLGCLLYVDGGGLAENEEISVVFACVCVCVLNRSGLVICKCLRQSCQIFDRLFLVLFRRWWIVHIEGCTHDTANTHTHTCTTSSMQNMK